MDSGSPFDYRIALISLDNAVELSLKTYLGLPKRARGAPGPTRKEFASASTNFADLMDLTEKYASDKLSGIELGDIEWYHRLRNALYHEGNGVTVDSGKVDAYLQVARILLRNLFGVEIEEKVPEAPHSDLGIFVLHWATLESTARALAEKHLKKPRDRFMPLTRIVDGLVGKGVLAGEFRSRLHPVASFRNQVMHGLAAPSSHELSQCLQEVTELVREIGQAS